MCTARPNFPGAFDCVLVEPLLAQTSLGYRAATVSIKYHRIGAVAHIAALEMPLGQEAVVEGEAAEHHLDGGLQVWLQTAWESGVSTRSSELCLLHTKLFSKLLSDGSSCG